MSCQTRLTGFEPPKPASSPTLRGTDELVENKIREYLMDWYLSTPTDFEIDWSDAQVGLSPRMTRAMGNARSKGPKEDPEYQINISGPALENHGWDEIEETIRHEAIHIWQYQNIGKADHGPTFERWAKRFDVTKYADKPAQDFNYVIECANCGVIGGRTRRSKIIKHPEKYRCSGCGESDTLETYESVNAD